MKKNANEVARSFAMITQLGISMLAPIVLCAVIGNWLDDRFGWSVTAVFLILGILAGARNTWILVKNVIRPDDKGRVDDENKNK
jgi:ATP synthase protein I